MKGIVSRYPVCAFFAVTFALSWGSVLLVVLGRGHVAAGPAYADPIFPFVFVAMLLGPSIAGISLTALSDGMAGVRDLGSRLIRWHVKTRWYADALLAAPLLLLISLSVLWIVSSRFLPGIVTAPNKRALIITGLIAGAGAGFFEELGWTGFAVPHLLRHYSQLRTGVIVGVIWGAWHILAVVWGLGMAAGTLPIPVYVTLDVFSFLPAYRVLMVKIYSRSHSLLIAVLMHASLTASMLILGPLATTGVSTLLYLLVFTAMLWAAALS